MLTRIVRITKRDDNHSYCENRWYFDETVREHSEFKIPRRQRLRWRSKDKKSRSMRLMVLRFRNYIKYFFTASG